MQVGGLHLFVVWVTSNEKILVMSTADELEDLFQQEKIYEYRPAKVYKILNQEVPVIT